MAVDEADPSDDADQLAPEDAADQKVQDLVDSTAKVIGLAGDHAWVATALSVIAARFQVPDKSYHVQRALNQAIIQACRRIGRILRNDLEG